MQNFKDADWSCRVDEPRYDRDRSASPRPARRGDSPRGSRARSASPNGRMDSRYVKL